MYACGDKDRSHTTHAVTIHNFERKRLHFNYYNDMSEQICSHMNQKFKIDICFAFVATTSNEVKLLPILHNVDTTYKW